MNKTDYSKKRLAQRAISRILGELSPLDPQKKERLGGLTVVLNLDVKWALLMREAISQREGIGIVVDDNTVITAPNFPRGPGRRFRPRDPSMPAFSEFEQLMKRKRWTFKRQKGGYRLWRAPKYHVRQSLAVCDERIQMDKEIRQRLDLCARMKFLPDPNGGFLLRFEALPDISAPRAALKKALEELAAAWERDEESRRKKDDPKPARSSWTRIKDIFMAIWDRIKPTAKMRTSTTVESIVRSP